MAQFLESIIVRIFMSVGLLMVALAGVWVTLEWYYQMPVQVAEPRGVDL